MDAIWRRRQILTRAAGLLMATCYLAQYLTFPPNSSEGAVMMQYVQRIADGQRLHFDFIDYYGPFAWLPYGVVYALTGQTMFGVRVFLLALKVVSIALSFAIIRRAGHVVYAWLGAGAVTALLGQPWPFFGIAYAPHLTFPLLLGVCSLLLPYREATRRWRAIAAGVLTGLVLWTKVNTGAYVAAGVTLALVHWTPVADRKTAGSVSARERAWRIFQWITLVVVGVGFQLFVLPELDGMTFVYFSFPLWIAIAWAARNLLRERWSGLSSAARMSNVASYVGASVATWLVILIGYFGVRGGLSYLREQAEILQSLQVTVPMLPPGEPGQYTRFNRFFWPQLPWIVTAVSGGFFAFKSAGSGAAEQRAHAEPEVASFFTIATLHGFVIYPRGDESHLIQAVLPATVFLFAILARLERAQAQTRLKVLRTRVFIGLGTLLACGALISLPSAIDYRFGARDWSSPRLRFLRYHDASDDRGDEIRLAMSYRQWDRVLDETARRVDLLTSDGEEVLVLSGAHLLNYASHTEPVGKKYSHFFYLLGQGLLDRKSFARLVPASEITRLLERPPRVIVMERDSPSLLDSLPELLASIESARYERASAPGPFDILVRSPSGPANARRRMAPGRE